jgi:hypothetical protein
MRRTKLALVALLVLSVAFLVLLLVAFPLLDGEDEKDTWTRREVIEYVNRLRPSPYECDETITNRRDIHSYLALSAKHRGDGVWQVEVQVTAKPETLNVDTQLWEPRTGWGTHTGQYLFEEATGELTQVGNWNGGCVDLVFPDEELDAAVRGVLTNHPDEEVTMEDLAELDLLSAVDKGIADLSGIKHCTELTRLDLSHNEIIDISPLSQLINLDYLALRSNKITDISPLVVNSGLEEGDTVDLQENPFDLREQLPYLLQLHNRGVRLWR